MENDVSEAMDPEDIMKVNITLSNEETAEEIMAIKPLNKISTFFEMETIFSTKSAPLLYDIIPEESKFDKIRKKTKIMQKS